MAPLLAALSAAARALQDSAAALPSAPFPGADSVVVESPLPGGVNAAVRWLFSLPQWIQATGAAIGALVGVALLWMAWKHRVAIRDWIVTRERRLQFALAAGVFLLVLAGAGAGYASWNYMEHDNGFCVGCHVMKPSFQEFANFKDKHDTLECHDCHQQSIFASMRQLYLWVAERPEEIGTHAPVPNTICLNCHGTNEDEKWTRIASTAGHRVHMESDSSALREVQCVTCHGLEVHRFVPANRTCGQSGCHEEGDTQIVLGRMAGQTALHCNTCHQFTAEVPSLATVDSAAQTMSPARQQCLSCHEMQRVLGQFNPAREPHGSQCGVCHNPHTQETPAAAVKTCASAQCHADWRQEPFHIGAAHRQTGDQCLTCHQPHAARVDASDCEGCHAEVRSRTRLSPPAPFDTSRALRRAASLHDPPSLEPPRTRGDSESPRRGKGDAPPEDDPSGVRVMEGPESHTIALRAPVETTVLPGAAVSAIVHQQRADSFPHARHRALACLTCHRSTTQHSALTFEAPRGCNICHHQAAETARCAACHRPEDQRESTERPVTVTTRGHPARTRSVAFAHTTHASVRCQECHTEPVTLGLAPAAAQCAACHTQHHDAARECASCHRGTDLQPVHARATAGQTDANHQRCDACHTPTTVALLTPTRSFCASCHPAQQRDHYQTRDCTTCHFLTDPGTFRRRLHAGGTP